MRHECLKFYEFFFEIDDETSTLYSTLAATAEQQATQQDMPLATPFQTHTTWLIHL